MIIDDLILGMVQKNGGLGGLIRSVRVEGIVHLF
jgi:hypothetical protein